jgi:hypothetical protein
VSASAKPRVILEIIEGHRSGGGDPPGGPPPAPPDDGTDATAIPGSHIALGEGLGRVLAPFWRYASGRWFCWDGCRWKSDEKRGVWYEGKQFCKQEGALIEDAKLARAIHSDQSIMASVRIASAEPEIACVMSEFDRDPWLLNTPGRSRRS